MERIKIIVTGGTGFIGSHLVEELLKNKTCEIVVVDIKIDPLSYFAKTKLQDKVDLSFTDIRDKEKIRSIINKIQPDYIFHLAAEPIVEASYEDPINAFETNIMGTANILEACREVKKIKGILVASSDKAYGKSNKAYKETDALNGDHPYDVSKSCQDLISSTYFSTYKLPIVVTRFGNVYGEGDVYLSRIVPGICNAAINNKTLEIRSDGKYVRDYLYVKDVVRGYLFLLKNIDSVIGEAFNFSSQDNLNVMDVIVIAEKELGIKIKYAIKNTAKNEIPYQHLDDRKIRKLGWKNEYSMSNTIKKIKEWYANT